MKNAATSGGKRTEPRGKEALAERPSVEELCGNCNGSGTIFLASLVLVKRVQGEVHLFRFSQNGCGRSPQFKSNASYRNVRRTAFARQRFVPRTGLPGIARRFSPVELRVFPLLSVQAHTVIVRFRGRALPPCTLPSRSGALVGDQNSAGRPMATLPKALPVTRRVPPGYQWARIL